MAIMIPDLHLQGIKNDGERRFYKACAELPYPFIICYAYKYQQWEEDSEILREADFVITHPRLGFVVMEVKQGTVMYSQNCWQEFKEGRYQPLHRNASLARLNWTGARYFSAPPEPAKPFGHAPSEIYIQRSPYFAATLIGFRDYPF